MFINSIKQNKFKLHRFFITFMYSTICINISYNCILFIYIFFKFIQDFFLKEDFHIHKISFFIILILITIIYMYINFFKLPQTFFLIKLKNIKDITPYANLLEYYQILPIFLINLCFMTIILAFFFEDCIFIDLLIPILIIFF